WNNLASAFLPDAAGGPASQGVFKKTWAGLFFGNSASTDPRNAAASDPACGRFSADICAAYFDLATTGHPSEADVALLDRSSPSRILGQISAPTLLIQGEADSLFPLDQADANARGIAAAGTPVRVAWFT